MERKISYTKIIVLISIFYAVGIAGHIWDRTFELMLLLTPYTILATIIIAVAPYILSAHKRIFLWAGITAVVTLALEILGVETGMIFGSYEYGSTLGLKILGVPVLIGLNWVIVVLGAIALSEGLTSVVWQRILAAAVFTVVFDMVLEPVAMGLDYWDWTAGVVPIKNYIAWGVISAASAGLYHRMRLSYAGNRIVPAVFIIQFVFFTALWIFVV